MVTRKIFSVVLKKILSDQDESTLAESFDNVIQEKQLNYPPSEWLEGRKNYLQNNNWLFKALICSELSCQSCHVYVHKYINNFYWLTHPWPMFQFHTPWKLLVSGIFRGYKMGALTWNGMFLILFSNWAVYSEKLGKSVNKNLKRL